ncbi:hypothetical protein PHMEG_00019472 [Phytophthora megakarya]|uniref:Uncharacterized protein n=1 Tax=Phytophthora megakarya TaxID=4795 RepID=A0A225VT03_9STRA|nr:hypothetical protein PHMEG_00019472 [Phytophthora megakarya]
MNPSMTELPTVDRATTSVPTRHSRALEEVWRNTKKLHSYIAQKTVRPCRSQPDMDAMDTDIADFRTCKSLPVQLLYPTDPTIQLRVMFLALGAFHHRQIRQVLRIRNPKRASNAAKYKRCNAQLLRYRFSKARWMLFGQIRRG